MLHVLKSTELFILFLFLFDRKRQKEIELLSGLRSELGACVPGWAESELGACVPGWAESELGAWNSTQASLGGGRKLSAEPASLPPRSCMSRKPESGARARHLSQIR